MFNNLRDEIQAIMRRDPAARSRLEVLICYPGLHAVRLHRVASWLWRQGFRLPGRMVSQFARWTTGIEIHPGATIGRRLFIDHGMGVVIGETSRIGNDVTLYQGVTLGGMSLVPGKRHPTLEDGVIVGAGAKVLGPVTMGEGSRVGSNAVVLTDAPKGATMVGIPAKATGARPRPSGTAKEFQAYGTPAEGLPDPVARAIDGMGAELAELRLRLEEIERRMPAESGADTAGPNKVVAQSRN